MYFAIDFSQTENLNRLMDHFWLAFIVTFFTEIPKTHYMDTRNLIII